MQRYFVQVSYRGTAYNGWQFQPNAPSVQETIERCFSKVFGNTAIPIVGCGRTDAGVHAKSYFFHVDLPQVWDEQHLCFKLNRMLPPDISAIQAMKVSSEFHARFHATKRTYRYFLHQHKDPFQLDQSWYFQQQLDFSAMNTAAQRLLGTKDFGSFSKLHTVVKPNICTVFHAEWVQTEDQWYFEISANRFLRNMVRAIVGTLIEVGLGNLTIADIDAIIEAKDRGQAAVSVPAHGLFLWDIVYPTLTEN
ncbi:MAG: tRNA pseudouridine(38-40) synthase TruA [Crocinitomicaceae bacterium]|nr:tRNA pseudouridine(38-40) synthase TruA [Crocinitomicaceae bacterium]